MKSLSFIIHNTNGDGIWDIFKRNFDVRPRQTITEINVIEIVEKHPSNYEVDDFIQYDQPQLTRISFGSVFGF